MQKIKPWYWRSLPLEYRTGSQVFDLLFRQTGKIATLLESPYPTSLDQPQLTRYSICAGKPRIIEGQLQLWTPPVGQILPFLRRLLETGRQEEQNLAQHSLPFTGGWLGWLGYDLAWEIEQLPRLKLDPLPFPVAFWYEPASFAVLDHGKQTLWLAATTEAELNQLNQDWEQSPVNIQEPLVRNSEFTTQTSPHFFTSQSDYENTVRQAKKYIQAGDIFQANLSLRFEADTTADSWDIYQALQQINPSPFASYWKTPWGDVISCSPERLVKLQQRHVQTRPIAGTRRRGETPEQEYKLKQDLILSPKERAEHIMLVDLERNDLGKVCQWGSVKVNELLSIERYSHVIHLVSNIIGTLRSDCDPVDSIRAVFPGGTITGCPKVRCMEIIEELEPLRRSLFYGSCGYLDQRGNLDLNILIRTLLFKRADGFLSSELRQHTVWGQVGAGIVADSEPEQEWYESLNKAQAQIAALHLAIKI